MPGQMPQQAKERVLPRKCGSFCEKCYEFLVMYCNYEYLGKIKKIEPDVRVRRARSPSHVGIPTVELRSLICHMCTLPQTLNLAREMCEKAKTIGDPENHDILNRLCTLLERRLAKKKEKNNGGTGKRNAGLVGVISICARTQDTHTCTPSMHPHTPWPVEPCCAGPSLAHLSNTDHTTGPTSHVARMRVVIHDRKSNTYGRRSTP